MIGRRRFIVGALLGATALTGAGGALVASSGDGNAPATDVESSDTPAGSELVEVGRGDLTDTRDFNGTLTYGDSLDLPIAATGIVTARPEAGSVIEPGEELLRINNRPVFLARSDLPMYRTLRTKPDVKRTGQKYMAGFDVVHLQGFLLDAGFDDDGKLDEIDGQFGPSTVRAVKAWQKSVGLPVTGEVDRTQMIFMPEAVRIDTTHQMGVEFTRLAATANEQTVTFSITSRDRRLVAVGNEVQITAGDVTTTGAVERIERTTDAQGNSTLRVTLSLAHVLPVDAGTPEVIVVEVLATDVLTVPVRALLAVSEGGFAVERPDGTLSRVDVGAVANSVAEITGELSPGDQVVVPT